MRSNELNDYLNSIRPSISQRKHDGKWAVWVPLITFAEDESWSLNWEVRGVFNNYGAAASSFKTLTA